MPIQVLVADKLPNESLDELTRSGCEVSCDASLSGDALRDTLAERASDILIVRSTRVQAQMIESNPKLSVIIRAGAGYDNIDIEAASMRGVYVANCPGKNSIAVAELAFGLLVSLDRQIPDNVADLRQGKWNKQLYSKASGLYGRTLGILGLGRIGQAMAVRGRAFGMRVLGWSRSLTDERAGELGVQRCASIGELAELSDAVSVHLALTGETRGLLGADFFSRMRPGAFFINTARAELVDESALLSALEEQGIRAGVDLLAQEPPGKAGEIHSELARHPSVYGTHHIGASTEQAQKAVADEAVAIVAEYLRSGRVRNCVNLTERTQARYSLSVHHRNRVGVLASVLDLVRDRGINVETMENSIFLGGEGACANIQIDDEVSADDLRAVETLSEHIFSAVQTRIE